MSKNEQVVDESLNFEALLTQVHSVNLHDRAKPLGECIEDELSMALQKVNEYKRNAEVNIKLVIRQGDRQQVQVIAEVSSKVPKGCITSNVFYQEHKEGKLYQDDPNQLKMFAVKNIAEKRAEAQGE